MRLRLHLRITGLDFCVRISTDIAEHRSALLACSFQFVEFVTCNDTRKITSFVDGGKTVEVVGQFFGMGFGAGCMTEYNVGEFLCSLNDVIFVTEAVGKDDVASLVCKVCCGVIASCVFGNTGFDDNSDLKFFCHCFRSVDEVLIVSAVLIVQSDKTEFDVRIFGTENKRIRLAAIVVASNESNCQRCHKCDYEHKCQDFFLHRNLRILCLSAFCRLIHFLKVTECSSILSTIAREQTLTPCARNASPPP